MKTICVLNGRIIMSQDGDALKAMKANAMQYPGAVASVVSDSEYVALKAAQPKTVGEINDPILAQMEKLNPQIIDAMADGDTVRVTSLRAEKAALRAQLV